MGCWSRAGRVPGRWGAHSSSLCVCDARLSPCGLRHVPHQVRRGSVPFLPTRRLCPPLQHLLPGLLHAVHL